MHRAIASPNNLINLSGIRPRPSLASPLHPVVPASIPPERVVPVGADGGASDGRGLLPGVQVAPHVLLRRLPLGEAVLEPQQRPRAGQSYPPAHGAQGEAQHRRVQTLPDVTHTVRADGRG